MARMKPVDGDLISLADDVRNAAVDLQLLIRSGQPAKAADVREMEEVRAQLNTIVARIEERDGN